MTKSLVSKIGFVLTMSLILTGCQAGNVQPAAVNPGPKNIPGTPYSHGPSSPPSVKGPTAPFPSAEGIAPSSQQAQPLSMTETENKKFTLS
jgi:hypothetical protein